MLTTAVQQQDFLEDVLQGLKKSPKEIPCKYFYDKAGSELFERICGLKEYYVTRAELAVMQRYVDDIASFIGTNALVIEYGAGSGIKTRILLHALQNPEGFVPVDISLSALEQTAFELRREFPHINITPFCKDFTQPLELVLPISGLVRRVVYFPGSTVGNFRPPQALAFLKRTAALCRRGGGLVIGVDLKKDARLLEAAYNDSEGVTAGFNLNLLHRINRELGGSFDISAFEHKAVYNEEEGCIEMRLVSAKDQDVRIQDQTVHFEKGEWILTERSYKYSLDEFKRLARGAGFTRHAIWIDPDGLFSVQYFNVN